SDLAGSLRLPAAACGTVSLMPTAGRVSTDGHIPTPPEPIADWNRVGPLARRIEDLALALEVLSETPVRNYRQIDLKERRVLVYIRNPLYPVTNTVADTVAMAAGALRSAGMEVVDHPRPPMLKTGFQFAGGLYSQGAIHKTRREVGGGQMFDYLLEARAHLRRQGRISLEVLFFHALIAAIGSVVNLFGFGKLEGLERSREAFLRAMTPDGVLLCPVFVTAPPRHGWTWRLPVSLPYTMMFNALGFPAVTVPVRWSRYGLPLAVQVVAAPGEDETALAVAAELERIFGGWRVADTL